MEAIAEKNSHPIVLHYALGILLLSLYLDIDLTDTLSFTLTGIVFLPFYAIWLARRLGPACWRALWIAAPLTLSYYTFWPADTMILRMGLGLALLALTGLIMLSARRHFEGEPIIPDLQPTLADMGISVAVLLLSTLSLGFGLNGDLVQFEVGGFDPALGISIAVIALILFGKAKPLTLTIILIGLALLSFLFGTFFPDIGLLGFEGEHEFDYEYLDWRIGWNGVMPWACGLGIAVAWGAAFVIESIDRTQKPARLIPIGLLLLALFALPGVSDRATRALGTAVESMIAASAEDTSQTDSRDPYYTDAPSPDVIVVTASKREASIPALIVFPLWLIFLGMLSYGIGRRLPKAGPTWLPVTCALLAMSTWLTAFLLSGEELQWFFETIFRYVSGLVAIILAAWIGVWLGSHDTHRLEWEEAAA